MPTLRDLIRTSADHRQISGPAIHILAQLALPPNSYCALQVSRHDRPHLSGITMLRKIFQVPSGCFCQTVRYFSTSFLPSNVASA